MVITEVFAGIAVADRDAGFAWYERLVGRAPDLVAHEDDVAWQLAGAGWISVAVEPERAGTAFVTLLVEDLEGLVAELRERGVAAGPIETIPGKVRTSLITDPDGNRLQVGEPLGGDAG